MAKTLKNFRLTDDAISMLAQLAKRQGVSEAVVIELLIREKAAALGITAAKS